jgi:hypothetical protein
MLDRVKRAIAWQRVDKIRYNNLLNFEAILWLKLRDIASAALQPFFFVFNLDRLIGSRYRKLFHKRNDINELL